MLAFINEQDMKLAKIFWIIGNLLVNISIGTYVYFSSQAPLNAVDKFSYINENWGVYAGIWKSEFVLMAMIALSSIYFAIRFKGISWALIAVGQLILLPLYPLMLGGYRNTPVEIAEMANQIAVIVFVFGNLVFLGGLLRLYWCDIYLKKWLKWTAVALSAITFLVFLTTYTGFMEWKQAMVFAPLAGILYLINAYYGTKIRVT